MRKVINISLPEHLYQEIEEATKQKGYGTKSELFRAVWTAWKEGRLGESARKFDAKKLLSNVRRHAAKGGPRDLSEQHDRYLYGE
ncbi:MAG TPA: ribbon-helix-helix domain-containing protein [Candidatus Paceibacterota bacterium]